MFQQKINSAIALLFVLSLGTLASFFILDAGEDLIANQTAVSAQARAALSIETQ